MDTIFLPDNETDEKLFKDKMLAKLPLFQCSYFSVMF
jgi:hypothetical protein